MSTLTSKIVEKYKGEAQSIQNKVIDKVRCMLDEAHALKTCRRTESNIFIDTNEAVASYSTLSALFDKVNVPLDKFMELDVEALVLEMKKNKINTSVSDFMAGYNTGTLCCGTISADKLARY